MNENCTVLLSRLTSSKVIKMWFHFQNFSEFYYITQTVSMVLQLKYIQVVDHLYGSFSCVYTKMFVFKLVNMAGYLIRICRSWQPTISISRNNILTMLITWHWEWNGQSKDLQLLCYTTYICWVTLICRWFSRSICITTNFKCSWTSSIILNCW